MMGKPALVEQTMTQKLAEQMERFYRENKDLIDAAHASGVSAVLEDLPMEVDPELIELDHYHQNLE
jgi:hypothetical protein